MARVAFFFDCSSTGTYAAFHRLSLLQREHGFAIAWRAPGPNPCKIPIMLEECAIPYRAIPVDLSTGQQRQRFVDAVAEAPPDNKLVFTITVTDELLTNINRQQDNEPDEIP